LSVCTTLSTVGKINQRAKLSNVAKSPENFAVCLHTTWWRLHAGGGIGKARTRAKNDVTCSVSDESAPPLAPSRLLAAVHF